MKIEDHTSRKVKISGVDRLFLFPVVEFGGCENFSVARGGGHSTARVGCENFLACDLGATQMFSILWPKSRRGRIG